MVLTDEEKHRIEEEESYRQKVREEQLNRTQVQVKPRKKSYVLPLLIVFIGLYLLGTKLMNSTSTTNNNSVQKKVPLSGPEQKEVAKTYCETHKLAAYKIPNERDMEKGSGNNYITGSKLTISDCENIIEKLSSVFSAEDVNKIAKGMIWVGMNPYHAIYSQGYPWDENQTVTGNSVRTQWVYGDPLNNATYLYFEGTDVDNWNTWTLTSWQD